MAIELRRCLYIGLGGTGMNSLLNTKKMFLETYGGEVPPMIGFLGIDTDGGAYTKSLDSKYGKVILEPFEQCSIICKEAKDVYSKQKEKFSWMHQESEGAIVAMSIGAGQIRTNGRLAFAIKNSDIETSIKNSLIKIQNANIANNKNYKLLANNVEIHMVFSICGGTGAGTFIDTAYLIKQIAPECKLTGYAVLADVFEAMVPSGPAMQRVKSNAYGSIVDLDWLMHLKPSSSPLTLSYANREIQVNERPFNAVMLIDNKNENNDVYIHSSQLAEMISLSLIMAAGKLSIATASVSDNIEKHYADGSMDIEDKKAWVASMGACEIIFNGCDLAEIYSIKASQRIIQRLLNSCNDIHSIVNTWIDSPEIRIRENDGRDDVIDFILPKNASTLLITINDTLNAKTEIDTYRNSVDPKKEVDNQVQSLLTKTKNGLSSLLQEYINQECGISNAEEIIANIQKQKDIFLAEMKEEEEVFKKKKPALEQALSISINELSELENKIFVISRSTQRQNLTEDVLNATSQCVINEREILRRSAAIRFYEGLQVELSNQQLHINTVKELLKGVNRILADRLIEIQNAIGSTSETFQIDLAKDAAKMISVHNDDIVIRDFLNSLKLNLKLYDLPSLNNEGAVKLFKDYTSNLLPAKRIYKTSIEDIIKQMDDDTYTHLMLTASNKALPLLCKNYQGYIPQTSLYEGFYIGVPDNKKSRLAENNSFANLQQANTPVDIVSTGMSDRIILYRQMGVIPAFAITALRTYKEKYDKSSKISHFDANLLIRMTRESYSIEPQAQEDDTLQLWVYGFIFGLIKNEDESYSYKSQRDGDPLLDNWVNMKLEYRDDAFEHFKQNISLVRQEFIKYIEEQETSRGLTSIQELKGDVKAKYLEDYSQIKMTKDNLIKKGNEKIAALIRKELTFVQNNL